MARKLKGLVVVVINPQPRRVLFALINEGGKN